MFNKKAQNSDNANIKQIWNVIGLQQRPSFIYVR